MNTGAPSSQNQQHVPIYVRAYISDTYIYIYDSYKPTVPVATVVFIYITKRTAGREGRVHTTPTEYVLIIHTYVLSDGLRIPSCLH